VASLIPAMPAQPAAAEAVIIDAWMQHPSAEFLADPMFDSLRCRRKVLFGSTILPSRRPTASKTSPTSSSMSRHRTYSCTSTPTGSSASEHH